MPPTSRPPRAAHVLELFVSRHCPACATARRVVQEVVLARTDVTVVERNIDSAVELDIARQRGLFATPAVVVDGTRVLYGVPKRPTLVRHLDEAAALTDQQVTRLTARPYTHAMAAHSKIWYLQHFRMLDALSDAQKRDVDRMTRMLEVKRGRCIYMEGDPSDQIFLLKAGAVKISSIGADGQETLLAFLHPGDLFGELAMIDHAPRDHVATAHEDAVICGINREMVLQVVQNAPALGYQITKLMGLRLRRFRTRVEELLCRSAPERVAQALLDLAGECGVRDDGGVLIRLRLNQSDLGNLVGLARETVNIVLQDFRQRDLIEIQGRRIRITDLDGLRAQHGRERGHGA